MISENAEEFAGMRVVPWEPGMAITEPWITVHRIGVEWGSKLSWVDKFALYLQTPGVEEARGLVVGMWADPQDLGGSDQVVEALVAARSQLPRLTALFLGDLTYEECEISWIQQTDVSPVFNAYPLLEHFRVRGGEGLRLGRIRLDHLKALVVETGGMDASIVEQVLSSTLPALEHLELWLGTENYGATVELGNLEPLFEGGLFPRLRYLGLRDSEIADAIAVRMAGSPLLTRLKALDLSLGTLGDEGALALLENPELSRLEKLDLHHHYLSEPVMLRLTELGIEVDLDDRQDEEKGEGRYVAVGE